MISEENFNTPIKYKDICNIFGLEMKHGGFVQRQIEELRKEYEIIKEGRYYYILKRLSVKDKLDILYYNNLKAHVETLMCTLFTLPKKNTEVEFDMKGLMTVLKIVNEDYHDTKYGKNKSYANILLGVSDENEEHISMFFNETELILQRIIKETLKDLESKQIITKFEIPTFAKKIYNKKTGKVMRVDKHKIIKPEDYDAFMQCKKETLREMGMESEKDLFNKGMLTRFEFIKRVANNINHDYYYTTYRLILNTKHIYELCITDPIEKSKIEKSCNELVKRKLIDSKQGALKFLSDDYKQIYIDAFVDVNSDMELRYKYKELRKLEEK